MNIDNYNTKEHGKLLKNSLSQHVEQQIEKYLILAEKLITQNKWQEAIELLHEILAKFENDAPLQVFVFLSMAYRYQCNFEKALTIIAQGFERFNNDKLILNEYKKIKQAQKKRSIIDDNCMLKGLHHEKKINKMTINITISLSYYNDEKHVEKHIQKWSEYADLVKFQILDDGSKIPAEEILKKFHLNSLDIRLFRVEEDISWNISGIRNLGATVCSTPWLLFCDMDQTFERSEIEKICQLPDRGAGSYYSFNRTSGKKTMGTLLVSMEDYWLVGGYDEDMISNYGYNDPLFRYQLNYAGIKEITCKDILCTQHTADCDLDRSTKHVNAQKMAQKIKELPRQNWDVLRFKWKQVPLNVGNKQRLEQKSTMARVPMVSRHIDNGPKMHCHEELIRDLNYERFIPDDTLLRWFNDRYSTSKHLLTLYSIVSGLNAQKIVEIGFGRSSFVLARAAHETGGSLITCDTTDFSYLLSEDEKKIVKFINGEASLVWEECKKGIDFAFLDFFSIPSMSKEFSLHHITQCVERMKQNAVLAVHDSMDNRFKLKETLASIADHLKKKNIDIEILHIPYNYGLCLIRKISSSPHGMIEDEHIKKNENITRNSPASTQNEHNSPDTSKWGEINEEISKIIQIVHQYTMVAQDRLAATYRAVQYALVNNIEGDIVECGVYKGGSSMIMAEALYRYGKNSQKMVWMYDTYTGMSKHSQNDRKIGKKNDILDRYHKSDTGDYNKWYYEGIDEVKNNIKNSSLDFSRFKFILGKVEDTIPGDIPQKICVLTLDTNFYESTLHELVHLYPLICEGGILIIDDYNHGAGCRKAVNEYFLNENIHTNLITIGRSAMYIKKYNRNNQFLINTVKPENDIIIKKRYYADYNQYIYHQKEKTTDPVRRKKWLNEEWQPKLEFFKNEFKHFLDLLPTKAKAIGLAARTGQEVAAMKELGMDAIGIDLVPNPPLVIEGDLHNIPFEDNSFDFAFTNAVDHSLYPEKFMTEAKRILKFNGLFLIHINLGNDTDKYGEIVIHKPESLIKLFGDCEVIRNESMPAWGGMNYRILLKNRTQKNKAYHDSANMSNLAENLIVESNSSIMTTYCISCFGEKYNELFLPSLIQSILDISCLKRVVLYTDMKKDSKLIQNIKDKTSKINFHLLSTNENNDFQNLSYTKIAGQKTFYWNIIFDFCYKNYKNDNLVFLDADTLVLKDISHFFAFDFDVAYTFYLNHMTPYGDTSLTKSGYNRLNSGVILAKCNNSSYYFFKLWKDLTFKYLKNGSPLNLEFMAEDQDALAHIIGSRKSDNQILFSPDFSRLTEIYINNNITPIKLRGFTCRQLNEPESIGLIHDDTHILHFKGGWRDILPDPDWNFIQNKHPLRCKENSLEQYNIWRDKRNLFFS